MKTTYLVFENGIGSALRVASAQEWDQILAVNRSLPRAERRFFIKDCITDSEDMDCMYIETTKDEYDRWHSMHQVRYKKRKNAGEIIVDSLDAYPRLDDDSAWVDMIADGVDWEDRMIDQIRVKELREELSHWRDWANELLDYYLSGTQREATTILSEKYSVSAKTIRERKRALEDFLKKFFE